MTCRSRLRGADRYLRDSVRHNNGGGSFNACQNIAEHGLRCCHIVHDRVDCAERERLVVDVAKHNVSVLAEQPRRDNSASPAAAPDIDQPQRPA